MSIKNICLWLALTVVVLACDKRTNNMRFQLLTPEETGITFENRLEESPRLNIFSYLYFYNGGGVATGDLNQDGLLDLYFTSNLEENKLYLNQGNLQFLDITEMAGVAGKTGWTTGVTMADVNGDGLLDIYVSQLGDYQNIRGRNQLYINQGNDNEGKPTFENQAKQFNLDLKGFSTQAAFFDYDLDGDLDMYMLNHSVHGNGTFGKSDIRFETHPLAGDKLMRNDNGSFTDVTAQSGIYSSSLGYGLGITTGDVNRDGYPDIYIGNDFHENDYFYVNNGDGTFTESLQESMRHTSRFSMGNDIGDINNDGYPDILSLDMLPADPIMLKASASEDPYNIFNHKLRFGYNHQFARNTLQLNLGNGHFSEIGLLSGVFATDWSWSGLIADLDLDGHRDLYIANGIKRRSNDLDYINYISNEAIQHRLEGDLTEQDLALVGELPIVKIPNYVFRNKGDLQFEDVSKSWGLNQQSFSNGAVYADLDNDGDLDLVTNNIDEPAFVYKNLTLEQSATTKFLKFRFKGKAPNTHGVGARVIIYRGEAQLAQEVYNTRGYQSAVASELVFGLGEKDQVDSITVIWPDHSYQVLGKISLNQTMSLNQEDAQGSYVFAQHQSGIFEDITDSLNINYTHEENKFIEFNREPLIPHMASTEGPKVTVGDINGDGLDDIFVGGARNQPAELHIQNDSGFVQSIQPAFEQDKLTEDTDALFLDVDQDQDLDLIVVGGGNEFRNEAEAIQVRLYLNEQGLYSRNTGFPKIYLTASVVTSQDFDSDGDLDLFIGGRAMPWHYGQPAASYLLRNNGDATFEDITDSMAPELRKAGTIKDAAWADLDDNGYQDLVLAGAWMPITVYTNDGKTLKKSNFEGLQDTNGWWNSIVVTDVDGDQDLDLVAGNWGLNSKLKASKDEPLSLLVKDFDNNGKEDPLLYHYIQGEKYLFATKDELAKQLVEIKDRFVKYTEFAKTSTDEIFPSGTLDGALELFIYELRSGVFLNDGQHNFSFSPFPIQAQFSPINAFAVTDYDKDGLNDLLCAGNFYEVAIERGRYDADYGTLLKNLGGGQWKWVPQTQSGLNIIGQVRDIEPLQLQNEEAFVFGMNNGPLQWIKKRVK